MPRKRRKRPNGHGSIFTKNGNTWIQWRQGGKRLSLRFPGVDLKAREAAELALKQKALDVAKGVAGLEVQRPPAPPLSKLADDWIARRERTHRAWRDDRNRWRRHLLPLFGHLRPDEVDQAAIRRLIETKLAEGLASTSCKHLVRLLSTFYSDLCEQGYARSNPARGLPRATRRLIRDAHDPKQTPFIERQEDIARIYTKLAQPFATMFAVGALTGMRPGEIIALEWSDVDLGTGRILLQRQVRQGKLGPPKNGKPRLVPIIEQLGTMLAEWRLATGGEGLLFKPLTPWRQRSRFIKDSTVRAALRKAFAACGLPATLTWYHASRHTYASQHVMGGGSIEKLREILGHAHSSTTERYAHMKPDLFKPEDLLQLRVSMSREGGTVHDLAAAREERRDGGIPVATGETGAPTESDVTTGLR
jgi:integrase